MAQLRHCGDLSRARTYRLASSKPAYVFQHVYHCRRCRGCGQELYFWRGEYPDGHSTQLFPVPQAEFDHWKRRIQAGEAKPEAQLTSEYTRRIAGDILAQGEYQTKLCRAHRWYKGERVQVAQAL